MPQRRWPGRFALRRQIPKNARRTLLGLVLLLISAVMMTGMLAVRSLVTELAVSSARDVVVTSVNAIVKDIMTGGDFDPGSLVTLEKDAGGSAAAITTNVAAVNLLSAEILERAVDKTAENVVTVKIPAGNLFGSILLMNRGPTIPVNVTMLSSSVAGFRSEMSSAGINQTRHQILLDVRVDVSVLMPWRTIGTTVDTEILVSETVIVGEVPESYLNWER